MLRLQLYWHFICDNTSAVDLVVVVVVVLRSSKIETQAQLFVCLFVCFLSLLGKNWGENLSLYYVIAQK